MDNPVTETKKFTSSLSFKLIVIFFMVLVLMIPASMIRGLIRERESLKHETEREIQENWGKSQTIEGPTITIPYYYYEKTNKETTRKVAYLHILPELLNIDGVLIPEIRYRSIYKVPVYTSHLELRGSYIISNETLNKIGSKNILWNRARMELGISDLRGIEDALQINFDKKERTAEPGLLASSPFNSGVHTSLKLDPANAGKKKDFSIKLDLRGSNSVFFMPSGKTTNVKLVSDWKDPSFTGAFLPAERDITEEGFSAKWKVLHFNRNYPQEWLNKKYTTKDSAFGVSLLFPVDHYRKSERSVKYALLFLTLTFTLFFFIEILNKKKVHPVQYLMVGASLITFYILLISLSEQLGFTLAFIIAAAAIILQISGFIYKIMDSIKTALATTGTLSVLYLYLFVLLQLQDYALLMGSLGLFLVLSIIMYMSRNINWSGR